MGGGGGGGDGENIKIIVLLTPQIQYHQWTILLVLVA